MHQHCQLNKPIAEAATETITVVEEFWQRARIPIQKVDRAKQKVMQLYKQWKGLKKKE